MAMNQGWAAVEMKTARLDDARRRPNLIRICERLAEQPGKSLSAALGPALRQAAHRLKLPAPDITVGMRTGDTPAEQRRLFARTPPDVLVTTPESLFLLLTSAARDSLRGVQTVIVDPALTTTTTAPG